MSTVEERLQRSIAEFYAMLDTMHFTGASQVVEVQQLKILIGRYPDHARFYLNQNDKPPTPAGEGAGSSQEHHR